MLMFDVPRRIVLASIATGCWLFYFIVLCFIHNADKFIPYFSAELLTQVEGFEMSDINCCGDKESSFLNVL
jgi:hypothetical protein